jgi:phosphopantothenoylcysteine decarboxylase / phosphopantothenate---cysteine ligase
MTASGSLPGSGFEADPALLQGKKVVAIVSGGIAAYKVVQVVRDLAVSGADVRVVMTRSAKRFVGEQTFASLSGNPVSTDLFGTGPDVPHVELARGADLIVVAPATANLLFKMAHGAADDIASATLLTSRCPVLVAPAMHTEMWEHPATQANVDLLRERGVEFVGPDAGALSSGDEGPGRLVEYDVIVTNAMRMLGRAQELSGVRMVVTAAGTQEPIDPVRFIGNRSSGLMGFEIAAEAIARGAKVTVVAGATNLPNPPGADVVHVRTAQQMYDAVVEAAGAADVVVKAAAVADFRIDDPAGLKLKKAEGPPQIRLVPTIDILASLGDHPEFRKPGSILVGFAAETEPDPDKLAALAEKKRAAKRADVIVANDVSSPDSGFEVPTNRAVIAAADGITHLGLVTKKELARGLIDRIADLRSAAE